VRFVDVKLRDRRRIREFVEEKLRHERETAHPSGETAGAASGGGTQVPAQP
jgi:hypothetical protein